MAKREEEIEKAKVEVLKIYTTVLRQGRVIDGIEKGVYSQKSFRGQIEKPEMPDPQRFPKLFQTLKEKKGVLLNERGHVFKRIKVRSNS